jgi:hypothetical protein
MFRLDWTQREQTSKRTSAKITRDNVVGGRSLRRSAKRLLLDRIVQRSEHLPIPFLFTICKMMSQITPITQCRCRRVGRLISVWCLLCCNLTWLSRRGKATTARNLDRRDQMELDFSYIILLKGSTLITYGHSQLKTGHPVRSAIHKQLNGRLVLRWVTTWESLLLYVLHFLLHPLYISSSLDDVVTQEAPR